MDLRDKVIVVTGGGNGIAREVVVQLIRAGARVFTVDLNESGLAETATLAAAGHRLVTKVLNITDREAVNALPLEVERALGPADAIVNIAGIVHPFTTINELDVEVIDRVMNVNFNGTLNMVKAFLPALLARPEAALINTASMGGLAPFPGQTAYGASKAAVKLLTEGIRAESKDTNLAVSIVFPGGVDTNITSNSGVSAGAVETDEKKRAQAEKFLTSPEDAAAKIVNSLQTGKPRVTIGKDAALLDKLSRWFPAKSVMWVAALMARSGSH